MKIKVGDTVCVLSGKDKTKTGKVSRISKLENKIVVDGVNKVKKHMKRTEQFEGGIIEIDKPINASNVMVVCPHCKERTRVGFNDMKGKDKKRICKKCNGVLDTQFASKNE